MVTINKAQLAKIDELMRVHYGQTTHGRVEVTQGVTHDAGHTSDDWLTVKAGGLEYRMSDSGGLVSR